MDNSKVIEESVFIDKWKKDVIFTLKQSNPNWDEKDIIPIVNSMLEKQMSLPIVEMNNNYTGEAREASMLSVLDWSIKRKPLIAGNGTFYKNQHEAINPVANMLDNFLKQRKAFKKQMFAVEDKTSDLYKDLDRSQLNMKINCNSYYGASGAPTSAFYSKWSGPATTLTAQSVISTTETTFEGFLTDNFLFIDVNECFQWMNTILKDDYEIDDFVHIISDKKLVLNRIKSLFLEYDEKYDDILKDYIYNLNDEELTRLYYKNQLIGFTDEHPYIQDLIRSIFSIVKNLPYANNVEEIPKEYRSKLLKEMNNEKDIIKKYNSIVNKEAFMDPNDPPESIIEKLKELNSYYMKYVYVPFLAIDKIHRLKYFKRKTVVIVDTDSNILNLDFWVDYISEYILNNDMNAYGRDKEHNVFIMVNMITYSITSVVGDILETYGKHSNIPEEYRGRFNMKNEFYFKKLVIGTMKKRYLSLIRLREGNLLEPPKPDCKGFDYMKSGSSEDTTKFYNKIVMDDILSKDKPDVQSILIKLKQMEKDIYKSIKNGDKTYLPIANAKELGAYKDPFSQQGVRGTYAWNVLFPDNNIELPSKVSMLKLNIFSLSDIEGLKHTNPVEYSIIKTQIFECKNKEIAKKGMQVIAIPSNASIPKWLDPYIDYSTIINNIIGQFKGVCELFGVKNVSVGKAIQGVNRKTDKFSNIIHF